MDTLKRLNRWWSNHVWAILSIAVGLLAFCIATIWLVNTDQNRAQTDRIQLLEDTTSSLSKALDTQRKTSADNGAPVVVPDSKEIRKDPSIVKGEPGATGQTGEPGATGSPGASGEPGENGKAGANGKDGSDGTEGSPGPTGPPGGVGPSGSTGQNGANGANGSDGAQGPIGPTGEKGDKGEKGDTGETGPAPSKWTFTFTGVTYTCTPVSSGSTEYTCTSDGLIPDPTPGQSVALERQPVYNDRRWYASRV